MSLVLYDTLRRDKVPFTPREPGRVGMYVCGPTVQDAAHVGHGRAAVVFDVLRRWLSFRGYRVRMVVNITDIDDKIIRRAQREELPVPVIAERYARVWNRAMDQLGVLPPDVQPRATGHILEMQQLIAALLDAGKAYVVDGNVLFRVRSFPDYGKLSHRRVGELEQGEDIVGGELKEDPLDFALWKAAKPGEPSWPSPWGPGRPGWHIECSAMAAHHLGHGFDIHGGGLDLVFPHHENEIAQHEAVHGPPFARYWVHNGMVELGTEKMSKSLGNIVTLEEAVRAWGRGPLRLWYLSAHHRTPLSYEEGRLEDARRGFERLVTFARVATLALGDDLSAPGEVGGSHVEEFAAAMDDDLNAPRAVAVLHELVSDGHAALGQLDRGDRSAEPAVRGARDALLRLGDDVLGLGIGEVVAASVAAGRQLAPLVEELLARREQARAARDWATADALRARLHAAGVVVEDRPAGPRWYVDPLRR